MATPDSIGTADCPNCGREIFARKNRSGLAYARCECCGVEVRHHIQRHSDAWVRNKVRLHQAPEPAPEKPANTGPAPAAKPAAKVPEKAVKSGAAPAAKPGGVFATLMGG